MSTEAMIASDLAERVILGSILLDNRGLYAVQPRLRAEHFALAAHRQLYRAMIELSNSGRDFGPLELTNALRRSGELERVGGVPYVSELFDTAVSQHNLEPFTDTIRDDYKRRHIRILCEGVAAQASDVTQSTDSCLQRLEETALRLRSEDCLESAKPVREIGLEVLNQMQAIRSRRDCAIGLTTGLRSLDRATTGIRQDEYWVVGALPSRGKTVLGVQIAVANAKQAYGQRIHAVRL